MNNKTIDLSGQWQFKQYPISARRMRDLEDGDWQNCTVPSSIYSCLIEAGVIDRKKLDNNPEDFFQISIEPWIFRKTFDLPENYLQADKIEIIFDGLDTFASIWLNGKLLSKTDNMFCCWRFDAAKLLKMQNNELLVKFDSAVGEGERLMKRFGRFNPDDCSLAQRAYVRKAQCQFGWDWAPVMPGCGIWQPVRLEAYNKGCIRDVHITTVECDKSNADVKISVQAEKFSRKSFTCDISITGPAGKNVASAKLELGDKHHQASTVIKIKQPQLWQPRPYGSQPLYKMDAKIYCGDEQIDTASKTFGIRTVKLNQSPDDFGQSFQFEVNDQPVYAKGADWIPVSLLIGSATDADYEKLLTAAVDANINFLRVWGGGVYETDAFYNICDRLGILVWQDFMFACSYYPDRPWFSEMIKKEAAQNIVRLRNHPSLALWCGNNEIDWLHTIGGKGKKFFGRNIYHKILPPIVHELDPDRDYITSTPLGPAKQPNIPSVGTVHQWNIWSGLKHTDEYLSEVPRFVSEFGFQALPCKKTLQNLFDIKNICTSDISLEKHDYQPNGTNRLHYYIDEYFPAPANIDEFIYLSQLMQARAIRKNVEHLRANSKINSGALFWQFNDCCPSISWSCIDYAYRKKALYYYARNFFAPVLVTASAKFNMVRPQCRAIESITVAAVNHSVSPQTALLLCRLVDANLKVLDEFKKPVSIRPDSVENVLLPKSFTMPQNQRNSFIHILLQNDAEIIAQNTFFYVPDKYFDFAICDIKLSAKKVDELNWNLTLSSKKLVKDIYIDCPFNAELSDNYFDLLTFDPVNIKIKTDMSLNEITGRINIRSLNSIITKTG